MNKRRNVESHTKKSAPRLRNYERIGGGVYKRRVSRSELKAT